MLAEMSFVRALFCCSFVESSLSEIRGTLKRGEQSTALLGRDQINEAVQKHVDLQRQQHEGGSKNMFFKAQVTTKWFVKK